MSDGAKRIGSTAPAAIFAAWVLMVVAAEGGKSVAAVVVQLAVLVYPSAPPEAPKRGNHTLWLSVSTALAEASAIAPASFHIDTQLKIFRIAEDVSPDDVLTKRCDPKSVPLTMVNVPFAVRL